MFVGRIHAENIDNETMSDAEYFIESKPGILHSHYNDRAKNQ